MTERDVVAEVKAELEMHQATPDDLLCDCAFCCRGTTRNVHLASSLVDRAGQAEAVCDLLTKEVRDDPSVARSGDPDDAATCLEWILADKARAWACVDNEIAKRVQVEQERDTLKAENAAWRDRFRAIVGEKHPDSAGNAVLTLKAENKRLASEASIARAERASIKAEALRIVAHHEQDIEAAFGSGYMEGQMDGYVVCNPEEALARFKASRKGGSDDKG